MIKKLIILTAPSGAGKTTIAYRLLTQIPTLRFSISATTREQREGEKDGKDYYFLTVKDFQEKIADKAFVEYEMVYKGKYYGTLKSELERIWQEGKFPLRVVDVVGARSLKEQFGSSALALFIQPPSLDALKERLQLRKSENETSLRERIEKARQEMNHANHFDQTVVNDDLERAVYECVSLIKDFIRIP